MKEKIMW